MLSKKDCADIPVDTKYIFDEIAIHLAGALTLITSIKQGTTKQEVMSSTREAARRITRAGMACAVKRFITSATHAGSASGFNPVSAATSIAASLSNISSNHDADLLTSKGPQSAGHTQRACQSRTRRSVRRVAVPRRGSSG